MASSSQGYAPGGEVSFDPSVNANNNLTPFVPQDAGRNIAGTNSGAPPPNPGFNGQSIDLTQGGGGGLPSLQVPMQGGQLLQSGQLPPGAPMPSQGQQQQPNGAGQSPLGMIPPPPPMHGGPDMTGNTPGTNMGFDNSGSDGGGGGQPTYMQNPMPFGNKPLNFGQFRTPQGLQIQGNPTAQVVGGQFK